MLTAVMLFVPLFSSRALAVVHNEPEWYSTDIWQQSQGLPQNTVITILQTRDGYLWVGTKGGVSRFDGVRFTTYDGRNKNQLREDEVWALAEGDDSSLWIGTFGGGVSRLKDGQFTVFTTKEGLINDFVTALCKDAEGGIWIGTDGGLSRFKDGKLTNYTTKDGLADNAIWSLYSESDGSVWIGTNNGGLNRFKDGQFYSYAVEGPKPNAAIRAICRDQSQALWLATQDGVFRLKDGKSTLFTTREGLSSNRTSRMHVDQQGNVWIGTHDGLNRYKDGKISSPKTGNIVSTTSITAIYSDREGSLWVGTFDQGLARLHQGQFISYTVSDGLIDDTVSSVLQDVKGNIWIGTGKGLAVLQEGKIKNYSAKDGLPNSFVVSLGQDKEGYLWVSMDTGLYRSRSPISCSHPQCVTQFTLLKDVSPRIYARAILGDRSGTVWIGSNLNGLLKYQDNRFTTYTTQNGLSSNAVEALAEDQEGNIWIGTREGLSRFKDGKFTAYTEKDGLVSNAVQGLHIEPDNTLWISTRQGVSRFKNGKFTNYTANEGLYANYVHHILEDNKGNLWMSCSKGIFRISKQQLNDFAEGKIKSVSSIPYGTEHGLSSTVATGGFNPGIYKTNDGRMWFATAKGVCVTDPAEQSSNTLPPPVHIEEVGIDQHAFDLNRVAEAPPGRGDLVFRYTGLSFLAPEKVRFKYKLEGYDQDWVDAGDGREIHYSNIPPGHYTFRVIAANNDGVWNETGASFEFYLKPYFYQTNWFYALCSIVVILFGSSLHQLRTRQLQSRERELVRVVDERTKDLQLEIGERVRAEEALERQHAFLKQVIDINPNFIFAKDREGRYTLVNRALADACRAKVEDLIGKTDADINPKEVESFRRDDLEVMETLKEKFIPEETSTTATGDVRWLQTVKRPIIGEDGKADQVLGVATDITERKRMEQELRQSHEGLEKRVAERTAELAQANDALRYEIAERKRAEEELRKRAAEISDLYNQAPCGYLSLSGHGTFIRINNTKLNWLGYTRDEVVGKINIADLIAPQYRQAFRESFSGLVEHGRACDVELEMIRKDGTAMPVLLSATAVKGTGEDSVMANATTFDITERKRLEDELRQSQKMEAVGRLAGGVAHDFNNLLTAILGYSDILLRKVHRADPMYTEILEIKQAGQRAAALTRQLLAFSRRQILQPRVLDLNAVVSEMEKMLRRLIGEDIELQIALFPVLWRVKADPGQIEQVLMNLAVNSRDAMPEGGKLLIETENVELSEDNIRDHPLIPPGAYVMLAVNDTGHGIDEEHMEHIFEPFFTTKEKDKGTGLGLSTVYGIVKQSGGHIRVSSEIGQGARFRIYLPRVEQEPEVIKERSVASEMACGRETILLVEDEEIVRRLTSDVLKDAGYTVMEAACGDEALRHCETYGGPIHLLVTDMVMPRMSGRELSETLGPLRPEMKVIYMSGYTDSAMIRQGMLGRGKAFMQKPFTPDDLLRQVRRVLEET